MRGTITINRILNAVLTLSIILVAIPVMAIDGGSAGALVGALLPAATIGAMALRALLDRRTLIEAEVAELEARDDLDTEAETRFDGVIAEYELLNAAITVKEKASNRSDKLSALRQTAPAGGSGGGFTPLPGNTNVPDQGNQRQLDPVEHPDSKKYSLLRAIHLLGNKRSVDGYEGEISQEMAKRSGKDPQGFFMPMALRSNPRDVEQRTDLNMTTGVGGLQTATSNTMIGLLRNKSQVIRLGATMLNDMVGDFDIPKQSASGTAYWVGEATAPTVGNQTIGQVAFSPSTVGAFTDYTRKFTKQTSIDAEGFVRGDLNQVLAIELDRAALNGSGSGAEPEGALQNSSISTIAIDTNGGALTWASVCDLETNVGAANADAENMAYLTNATARGHAKQKVKVASTDSRFIWEEGEINGYPAAVSNSVPSNLTKGSGTALSAMLFGDFSTVFIATWGGIDVNVDPYSLSTTGNVRVVVLLDTDIQFRHVESLAKIVDIDTAL
jgi:HK97 family phage major capsid protein